MKASLFAILLFLAGLAAGRSRKDVESHLNLVARTSGAKLLSSSSSSNEPKKCEPFAVTCSNDCMSYSVCVSKDNPMKTDCPKDPADNTRATKYCNPDLPYAGCSVPSSNPCNSNMDKDIVCTLNNEFFPYFKETSFTKFYYCLDSKAMIYTCPTDEVVNITSMTCMAKPTNFQAPVNPCKEAGMLAVKENPSYFAFCSDATIKYLFKCPSGQTFSEVSRTCKTPCKNGDKWAHPKECNKYIQCESGTEVVKECFVGGFFIPATKSCGFTKPPNCT